MEVTQLFIKHIKRYLFRFYLILNDLFSYLSSKFKCTKDYVAVKCVEKSILSKTATDNLITEIRLLKTLNHKHIVEMKEFLWDDK